MADVTYHFDTNHATTLWETNPAYMVDNILTNYAQTSASDDTQVVIDNTCPGTNLGTITKVEVRYYAKGDGGDKISLSVSYGGVGSTAVDNSAPGINPAWSNYFDITGLGGAPDPWAWSDVQDLDFRLLYSSVAKSNEMYCAKVEIRATYTPSAGYYHGLQVQGVGELALCDVGTNPLRIRKGGTTYGIELVATDDPNASAVRIKTPSGVKAIRSYT